MSDPSIIPTPATPDVCTMALLVDGTDVSGDLQVMSIAVSRELNRIPAASIQIEDGEAAKGTFAISNSDRFVPGKTIEIQLGYRAQNGTVFKGLIVKQRIKVRKNGSALTVDCSDDAVKMVSARKSRYFIDKKDSDIMEELLGAHGLGKDVEATTPTLKEVVQYDATDWDFLLCRAEANGQVVLVQDDKVRVAKPATSGSPVLQMAYGRRCWSSMPTSTRGCRQGIKASSWKRPTRPVDADAKEPTPPAAGNIARRSAKVLGDNRRDQARRRARGGRGCKAGPTLACAHPARQGARPGNARASPPFFQIRSSRSPHRRALRGNSTSPAFATASPAAIGRPTCNSD